MEVAAILLEAGCFISFDGPSLQSVLLLQAASMFDPSLSTLSLQYQAWVCRVAVPRLRPRSNILTYVYCIYLDIFFFWGTLAGVRLYGISLFPIDQRFRLHRRSQA
jgi:hypothetical protein